jgi:hypothetical protein
MDGFDSVRVVGRLDDENSAPLADSSDDHRLTLLDAFRDADYKIYWQYP